MKLVIENLSFSFHRDLALLRNLSFMVEEGQCLFIKGSNGSGKTTTGKIVLNIIETDEGSAKLNTNRVAYVPQKINIDWAIPLRVIDFMNMTSKLDKIETRNCLQ